MPAGIETVVEDGFARVTFTDPALRGPALTALLEDVGPEFVSVDTSGTRKAYVVPASAAAAAGLIDGDLPEPEPEPEPAPEPEPVKPAAKAPAKKSAPKKVDPAADPAEDWA